MSEFDPPLSELRRIAATALAEDLGVLGDITSIACVAESVTGRARFVAREGGVLAGTAAASEAVRQVDHGVRVTWDRVDGDSLAPGESIGSLEGSKRSMLTAERTALNLLTHCSGIATLTRAYVDAAAGRTVVRDTRKTLPGLRALEKAAVRAGGGANHRDSLSDAILIKDNHLAGSDVAKAVLSAREQWPGRVLEVECDTLEQVIEAVEAGADLVLLDNMSPQQVADAVTAVASRCEIEVSGGVSLATIGAYAATGVDYVAIGALTHSAPALDIGLDFETEGK